MPPVDSSSVGFGFMDGTTTRADTNNDDFDVRHGTTLGLLHHDGP